MAVTGSGATVTSFGTVQAGAHRYLAFADVNTLTHNATSLILPGAANITTATGDALIAVSLGSGNWKVISYQRAAAIPTGGPWIVSANGSLATLTYVDNGVPGTAIILFHDTASPTVGDDIGTIGFNSRDTAGNLTSYGGINVAIGDATNGSEDGVMTLVTVVAGSPVTFLDARPTGSRFYVPLQCDGATQIGTFSTTGVTDGTQINTTGLTLISRTGSSNQTVIGFYNANGQVGGIRTTGSSTAYDTSSDERLKHNWFDFDALDMIRQIEVGGFYWKVDGSLGYGVKAQQAMEVFPMAYSKFMPLAMRAIQQLEERVRALEALLVV